MKKYLILFICLLLFFSCGIKLEDNNKLEKKEKTKVVSSIVPISSVINYIGGNFIDVKTIVPSGISPHGFDLKTESLIDINKADLIIYLGLDHIDGFLEKGIGEKDKLIVSKNINFIEIEENHLHDDLEENNKNKEKNHQIDPHIWLGINNIKIIAGNIKEKLILIDEKNKKYYEKNYNNFVLELDNIINEFKNKNYGKTQKNFIIFHDGYNYLFKDLGIENSKKIVFKSNILTNPDSVELKEIIDKINTNGVENIFREPQFNSSVLNKFAKNNDLEIGILDPLGFDFTASGYLDNLKANLNNLEKIYE